MNSSNRSLIGRLTLLAIFLTPSLALSQVHNVEQGAPLPGTSPLEWQDDIASRLVTACDQFLNQQLAAIPSIRTDLWNRTNETAGGFEHTIEPRRERLRYRLGLRDAITSPVDVVTQIQATGNSVELSPWTSLSIRSVQWGVLEDPDPNRSTIIVNGEGLIVEPTGRSPLATVVALPHCDQAPEDIVGLTGKLPPAAQFARALAESGCRVIVPDLIGRSMSRRSVPGRGPGVNQTDREFLYRSAFELGRHLIGYEVQKAMALVDWSKHNFPNQPVGVIGYGDGGRIAMYLSALDPRVQATCISAAFGSQELLWQDPIDRNVFDLLNEFGDAEVASLAAASGLVIIDPASLPERNYPSEGGAPATLTTPRDTRSEADRIASCLPDPLLRAFVAVTSPTPDHHPSRDSLARLLTTLAPNNQLVPNIQLTSLSPLPAGDVNTARIEAREQRQFQELDLYNQLLLAESPYTRKQWTDQLNTSSVESYVSAIGPHRERFYREVIGQFDLPLQAANPRSRLRWETDKWTAYEVVLDVMDGVFAYGVLILPRDIPAGEKRPVVVCQHGLEGRPTDVFLNDHYAYHDYAAKIAERGYITFAPQNIYIFHDRFRVLQRKANPLGKSLFSIMIPQHQQIVNWLKTLPQVDADKIAFYGLSYGGKSAMRIPAVVTDYCLSICSADFNEWVGKNASTRAPFSYVWTNEYEIFEFDLGSTFNYAEMAALIAPRPFMVERGHYDGVGWDEWVAFEYAKVRHLYAARLKLPEHTTIEFFDGPHTINGQGTFQFLDRHLGSPR